MSSYAPSWRNQEWSTTGADTYHPAHFLDTRAMARLRYPQNYVRFVYTYVPDYAADQRRYKVVGRTREEIVREGFDLGFGGWASLGTRGTP